jgi:mRNA-degrading endonuclease RelE of RelBE toxin-antitoxin system
MAYQTLATYYFDKEFKKLTKKDGLLKERVIRKLLEISINPEIGEPKRHALKGLRSERLDPFVIIYAIIKDSVLLVNFDEHDKAYDTTPQILDGILNDPRTVDSMENAGITPEEYADFLRSFRKRK